VHGFYCEAAFADQAMLLSKSADPIGNARFHTVKTTTAFTIAISFGSLDLDLVERSLAMHG